MQALRDGIVFVDDARRALGFSEREEPDLEAAEQDPESSELYLPGGYVRKPIDPSADTASVRGKIFMELWDSSGQARLAGRSYSIDGRARLQGITDDAGRLLHEGGARGRLHATTHTR